MSETTPSPRQWKPAADGALHGYGMKLGTGSYVATIAAPTVEELETIWAKLTFKPFDRGRIQPVRISPEEVR